MARAAALRGVREAAAADFEMEQPAAGGSSGLGRPAPPAPPQLEPEPELEMESQAEALFRMVDTDGSGQISYNEFASWWSRRQLATLGALDEGTMEDAKKLWVELDADGSGDLDPEEFSKLMAKLATSDWKEAYDQGRGKPYYYNKKTKETRWHEPDAEGAVTAFMSSSGIEVQPRPKAAFGAALGRARNQARQLAQSDRVQRARQQLSQRSASARETAAQKRAQLEQSERYKKWEASAAEWGASAEDWKQRARAQHQDKIRAALVCTVLLTFFFFVFLYFFATYEPPVAVADTRPDTSTGGIGEAGEVASLTHEWQVIRLKEKYEHPIVMAGVPSTHETHLTHDGTELPSRDPAVARIRNVQLGCPGWHFGWCFEVRLQEPDVEGCVEDGGVHEPGETLSWMAVDRGTYRMHGQGIEGSQLQAGSVFAQGSAFVVVVPTPFENGDPVVISQVQTFHDAEFVKTRQRDAVGYTGGVFEIKLEQAEGGTVHGLEEIGWLAADASAGKMGQLTFEAELTPSMSSSAHEFAFAMNFTTVPFIFGSIATYHDGNPAMIRTAGRASHGVTLEIQEDTCRDAETSHGGENIAMIAIQSDLDGVLRADRLIEPSTYCPATKTYFEFIDTGQFISWSLAKLAAKARVNCHCPTGETCRCGKSHLATIKSAAEQACVKKVAKIARDPAHGGKIPVGWIGLTDADFLHHWFDLLSMHHGDTLASAQTDAVHWERHGPIEDDTTRALTGPPVVTEMIPAEQQDCGGLGTIVGGYGQLGRGQYLEKTFGTTSAAGGSDPLPTHNALHLEMDFVKVDSWDGETAFLWADDVLIWQQSFRHNHGRHYCGAGWADQIAHIDKTFEHTRSQLRLKLNSSLNQHSQDESFGIQNVIISYRPPGDSTWRWGGDDGTPMTYSHWHPGQPSGDNEHYVAVDWPNWPEGAWHDCESESQRVEPLWPRCFYGLQSVPRAMGMGPSAGCGDCAAISYSSTQWPGDNQFAMSMVLHVDHPTSPLTPDGFGLPHDDWLSVMHVGDVRGERSPAVWIKPGGKVLHIRTSTTDNTTFGCETDDLDGQVDSSWPGGVRPTLDDASPNFHGIHLTISVEYTGSISYLSVFVNGHPASAECNRSRASGRIRDYDAPLFIGGDPGYSGFSGEVQSICLHPGMLNEEGVASLYESEMQAAVEGVHVGAEGSLTAQIEEATHGRVLFNLAVPFRWDNMDAQFGHATDSFDVPGGALAFPSAAGGRFEVDTDHHHFGVEMTIRVIQSPNGQYRNVLHLGNDVEGFAHTIVLNPRNMKLIAGIARDGDSPGDLIADGGHGCESAVDVFLDEDVVVVYTYTDRGQGQNALVKLYINGGIQHGCEFTVNGADDAALLSKLQDQSKHTNLHLLLGDAPEMRHGVDISIPGFYGDIKRFVIHEAQLTDVDVANLYEPNCGKHLHGYYVEVTEPPAHVTTGGTGEVDGCTDWECYTLYFFTVVLFLIALMCCCVLGYIHHEKAPLVDLAPDAMPSTAAPAMDTEMQFDVREGARPQPEPEPEPEPPSAPARIRPPSLKEVGRRVQAQNTAVRAMAEPRRPPPSLPSLKPPPLEAMAPPPRRPPPPQRPTQAALSPRRSRGGLPDLEETEVTLGASVRGMAGAFNEGQAPGASLHEMKDAGGSIRVRTKSPARQKMRRTDLT